MRLFCPPHRVERRKDERRIRHGTETDLGRNPALLCLSGLRLSLCHDIMSPMKDSVKTISIIGLGLIGASLAASLLRAYKVYGSDADQENQAFAVGQGLIVGDAWTHLAESDLVIVATPVASVPAVIEQVFQVVGDRAIITDVASVKQTMISQLPQGIRYVGGHPMAGKEKGGIRQYSPALFENAVYALTATQQTSQADLETVAEVVKHTGAMPLITTAEAHDRAVSQISHLPHMIAYTLADVALDQDLSVLLAAGSMTDMTRVAASSTAFWAEVAFANRKNLLRDMRAFERRFHTLIDALDNGNNTALKAQLEVGKNRRDEMENKRIGQTASLFVGIEDKPSALGAVTTLLGEQGVNITGIRILNSREGIGGALKLEFSSIEERNRAETVLKQKGYLTER